MLRHLPLVHSIARRVRHRAPSAELDDLVSAGTIGLLEAVDRYDRRRGVPFASFAYPRIRGAIIDEIRRSRALSMSASGGTDPTAVLPLESPVGTEQRLRLIEVTEDPTSPAPGVHVELRELLDALGDLPPREREMLGLHTRGYTVAQIGRLHGCSDSRASQLIGNARLRLERRTAA